MPITSADINNYIELGGGVSASPLQLYYQPGSTQPEAFAWLTQPGVYYGDLSWDTSPHSKELDHLKNHRLLPYSSSRTEASTLPLSVVGTRSPLHMQQSSAHCYVACLLSHCCLSDAKKHELTADIIKQPCAAFLTG